MIVGLGDSYAPTPYAAPPSKNAPNFVEIGNQPPASPWNTDYAAPLPKASAKPAGKAVAKPKSIGAVVKAATAATVATGAPYVPMGQPPLVFGMKQKTFYIALATLLAAGGYYMVARGRRVSNPRRRRSEERRVSNPRGGAPATRIEKAKKFREEFHWGLPTNAVVTRKVHKQPKVAVKLGELHAVTYRTKKQGEKVQLFEHHFEGRKPWLAMDIDNKRLHLLGGSYTVGADGIAG